MPVANLPSSTVGPYPNPKNANRTPQETESMVTEDNENMLTEDDEQMITE